MGVLAGTPAAGAERCDAGQAGKLGRQATDANVPDALRPFSIFQLRVQSLKGARPITLSSKKPLAFKAWAT